MRKTMVIALLLLVSGALLFAGGQGEDADEGEKAIIYNAPLEWADRASQLEEIERNLDF